MSSHHYLSLINSTTLCKGDGSVINDNVDVKNLLTLVAGGFFYPEGVNMDASGNLYISDTANNRIQKVDTDGIIITVAGGGNDGGDGIPATDARITAPTDTVLDASGNLYITSSCRIRKVNTDGIITTAAGKGPAGYNGDGILATDALLNHAYGITIDASGNLYIADTDNHRIRKVNTNGIITTVAGNGTIGFTGDGGPAVEAQIDHPRDVAVDSEGNLYFSDSYNHRIRKVDTSGIITTIAGSGPAGSYLGGYSGDGDLATKAELSQPHGLAVDTTGNLYIADSFNNRVRKVYANGIIGTVAGSSYGISTFDVCLDPLENLYIADFDYKMVIIIKSQRYLSLQFYPIIKPAVMLSLAKKEWDIS